MIRNFLHIFMMLVACVFGISANAKDMTFEMLYQNHTNMIVAEGAITSETPDAFQAFLDANPFDGFSLVMALSSDGGSLFGGLRLGQMIREAGLDTTVERHPIDPVSGKPTDETANGGCFSACGIAFLGGVRRSVGEGSRLGFHQFSSAGGSFMKEDSVYITESATQLMGATVLGYIMEMGARPDLFSQLSEALPNEMWEPTVDERAALKIVTTDLFQDFAFTPYGKGVIAWAKSPENVTGRSRVGQVTAYCKGGIPYILLSSVTSAYGVDSQMRSLISEVQTGWSVTSEETGEAVSYGIDFVSIRTEEGLPLAELKLDTHGVEILKGGPVLISVDFPASTGAMFYLRTNPTQDDRAALDASFRLCIR
ncbi:hypothetical protein [Thioclava kandeliae]|uniref:Uncharacterized protein n=1 Tax=Thioclava kandeliae TaxID=3070818 RepID=A0ABV1SDG6_9RHOB